MKHVVELKYTNPSHEHVSLRRRVETVNRVVEAQTPDEALNRAANQQRSLGFRIQSANIVEQKIEEPNAEVIAEEVAAVEEVELDEAQKKLKPKYWRAEWRLGTQSEVDKNNKKIYDRLAKSDPAKAKAFHDNLAKMRKEEVMAEAEREAGYKMPAHVAAAQKKFDAQAKGQNKMRPQAGTLAAAKMKKEEVEAVEEGLMSGLKKAQVKWKTAHRAVYGKDPTVKSMVVGAVAKLAGAKMKTARAVGAAVGGKPVSKQQQAAAAQRAGKAGMAKMRNEESHDSNDVNAHVKGKKAADKMTKKAAEMRKSKIEGSVNKINMEPTMDLNKKAEK